ncbi:MAG: hypothetical protein LBJ21_01440 [Acidobacteriota bacterium]|jgi:hypothetical protein|nr:hypothetical protein [Acidobacteriota bacterium]
MNVVKKNASRREFVQGITTGAMGLAAGGCLGGAKPAAAQSRPAAQACTDKITVLNPMGEAPAVRLKPQARRMDTLDGKTIYFMNYGYPGSDNLLYEAMDWFKSNHPKTTLEYRLKPGGMGAPEDPALWEEMNQKADAMIIGVGH